MLIMIIIYELRVTAERFYKWHQFLRRNKNDKLSEYSLICSRHFRYCDIVWSSRRVYLKKNAAPLYYSPKDLPSMEPGTSQNTSNCTFEEIDNDYRYVCSGWPRPQTFNLYRVFLYVCSILFI